MNRQPGDYLRKLMLGFCIQLLAMTACANGLYPFDSPKQDAQFQHLLRELRCLVCQNQDLSDSNAELAKDLRREVYELVQENKTDTEIMDYLTSRYGDFILFKPPVKSITALLWFGPGLFLMVGIFIFWRTCLKKSPKLQRYEHE
jgi:cytochrome c-type biogenesis protein CcmH